MSTATHTGAQVISKTKMAIATAFLGAAALAAAGAGGNLASAKACATNESTWAQVGQNYVLTLLCKGNTVKLVNEENGEEDELLVRHFDDKQLYLLDKTTKTYTKFVKGVATPFVAGPDAHPYIGYYRLMKSTQGKNAAYMYFKLPEPEVVPQTTLSGIVASSSPASKLIAVGDSGPEWPVHLASFDFTAENGDVNISDISVVGGATASQIPSLSSYRISLKNNGPYDYLDIANPNEWTAATFNIGSVVVQDGETIGFDVYGVFEGIDDAAHTAQHISVGLTGVYALDEEGDALEGDQLEGIIPEQSGVGPITYASNMVLVRTKPHVEAVDFGSALLGSGMQDLYVFNVSAHSYGDVSWTSVVFDTSGTCENIFNPSTNPCIYAGSVELYEKTNTSEVHLDTTSEELGPYRLAVKLGTSTISHVETVAAGTTKTYVLKGHPKKQYMAEEELIMNIPQGVGDGSSVSAVPLSWWHNNMAAARFIWSDNSGLDESFQDPHWFNGTMVDGLPTVEVKLEK